MNERKKIYHLKSGIGLQNDSLKQCLNVGALMWIQMAPGGCECLCWIMNTPNMLSTYFVMNWYFANDISELPNASVVFGEVVWIDTNSMQMANKKYSHSNLSTCTLNLLSGTLIAILK